MLAQLQLQEGERLGLLREYLDLVQVHSTTVESSLPEPVRCRFLPASLTPSTSVWPVPALRYWRLEEERRRGGRELEESWRRAGGEGM